MVIERALRYITIITDIYTGSRIFPALPCNLPSADLDYLASRGFFERLMEAPYLKFMGLPSGPLDFEKLHDYAKRLWESEYYQKLEYCSQLEKAETRCGFIRSRLDSHIFKWFVPRERFRTEFRALQADASRLREQVRRSEEQLRATDDTIGMLKLRRFRYTNEGVPFAITPAAYDFLRILFGPDVFPSGYDVTRFGFGSYDFDLLLQYPDKPVIIPVLAEYGPAIALGAYESITEWLGTHGYSWIANKATRWPQKDFDPTRHVPIEDALKSLSIAISTKADYTFHLTDGHWTEPRECGICSATGYMYSSIGLGDSPCTSCDGTGRVRDLVPPEITVTW